jgi:hypothetical protein
MEPIRNKSLKALGKLGQAVKLLSCTSIWEVRSSNVGRDTDYHDLSS